MFMQRLSAFEKAVFAGFADDAGLAATILAALQIPALKHNR